jgi:alpha-glucosidase (family GH31 glycosyl hydrolase)
MKYQIISRSLNVRKISIIVISILAIGFQGSILAQAAEDKKPKIDAFEGNPPICPRWGFEPWIWEDNKNTQQAVLKLVKDYLDKGIPVGTIIIDSPWETAYNSFDWDKDRYPQPQKMIDELHQHGVRVVMWITGAMNRTSKDTPQDKPSAYDDVIRKGWVVNQGKEFHWWKGKGVHIDFTNKKACDWFGTQMDKLMKMGVDGWKVDEAEQYLADPLQATSIGAIKKAEFKLYYYGAIADQTKKLNPESLILARPFSASINKGTALWGGDYSGDWGGLRSQMHRLYTAAQGGYSAICVEIGGFLGAKPTKKTLIRYAQFGALMPVMNNGGSNGGLSNHLPWWHDEQTANIYRYYATLHSELVPYIFSYSVESNLKGEPIVRDSDIERKHHNLGEQLFVSLITSDTNAKEVALPSNADWIDYWNEENVYKAGSTVGYATPLDQCPIFIKPGAIIPMNVKTALTGHGDESSAGKQTLVIYPYEKSSFVYHRPMGDGVKYSDVNIKVDEAKGTITVKGRKEADYRLRIKCFAKPESVKGADSWRYDAQSKYIIADKKAKSFTINIKPLYAYGNKPTELLQN